jgi:trans-aconitate 2-methyltransferase
MVIIMADWNPDLYLKFENERTQPVRDLLSRINLKAPRRLLDIGCGPGNSTAEIIRRFPDAQVIGIDYSPAMIERAKAECPNASFIVCDAGGDLSSLGSFDLVFANASLQWLPDHTALLSRLFERVNPNGAIAVQLPMLESIPKAIENAANSPEFSEYLAGFDSGLHYFPISLYYDLLSAKSREYYLWTTSYYHVMNSHADLIEWFRPTALKPFFEQLPQELYSAFTDRILEKLPEQYPQQTDGRVLFPFHRLFFVAYNTYF